MPRVEADAHIPLPPHQLWELMRNTFLRPRWDLSVREVVRDDGTVPGTTTRLHYVAPLPLRLQWRWEGEYVSFQAPHTTSVRMVKGSLLRPFRSLVGTWLLRSEGDGTLLKIVVSFEPRFTFPFSGPLMVRYVRMILHKSLHSLRLLAVEWAENTGHADRKGAPYE